MSSHPLSTLFRLLLGGLVALGLVAGVPTLPPTSPLATPATQAAKPKHPRRHHPRRHHRRAKPKKAVPEAKSGEAAGEDAPAEPTLKRSNRMELDARLVRGEAARSGAVYLFQRAPRRLPPLVNLHQSYLDEIVVPVLGRGALKGSGAQTADAPDRTGGR